MSRATRHTATAGDRRQHFGELRPGDHVSFLYEDTPELIAFIVPFIKHGLAKGERCVSILGELEPTEVAEALAAGGVDVTRAIERGALVVLSAQEYYGLPPFEASRIVQLLRERVTEAISRGWAGLRIAVDMTWTIQEGVRDDALVDLESLLDEAVGPGPLLVCAYRRDRFHPAVLQRVIRSHAKVVAGDDVCLSLSALFQNLAQSDLQGLLQSASERRKRRGEFYFHQGDQATGVFVLTGGRVKHVRTDPDGRSVILRIVAPTEPFGSTAALGGTIRLASAQALEDSRALVWDTPTILHLMMKHPQVSLNALRLLAERVQEERTHLLDLAAPRVEWRLARLLLRLAQSLGRETPRGIAIEVHLSGHDLAELTITSPYTVSRILAAWKRRNIVDAQRERIVILDGGRLAAIAAVGRNDERPELAAGGESGGDG